MTRTDRQSSEAWCKVISECPKACIPSVDPLYALPNSLIDEIVKEVPEFWTKDEIDFELSLAAHGGGGFSRGQPFWARPFRFYPLSIDFSEVTEAIDTESEVLTPARDGDSVQLSALIEHLAAANHRYVHEEEELVLAYAGWLISNPAFCSDLGQLRLWAPVELQATGPFPLLPLIAQGVEQLPDEPWNPTADDRDFFEGVFKEFYEKWCLQTLYTWDIPLPLETEADFAPLFATSIRTRAGVHVFIPWYVLRMSNKIDIRKQILDNAGAFDQIFGSSYSAGPEDGDFGPIRCRRLFRLYVYRFLAIGRRYGDRIDRQETKLDTAFGNFFGKGTDNLTWDYVKRLRSSIRHRQCLQAATRLD